MGSRRKKRKKFARVYDVENKYQALYVAIIAKKLLANAETHGAWRNLRREFPDTPLGELKNEAKSVLMSHVIRPTLIDNEEDENKRTLIEKCAPIALDIVFQSMINGEFSN